MSLENVIEAGIRLLEASGAKSLRDLQKGQEWKADPVAYLRVLEVVDLAAAIHLAPRRPVEDAINTVTLLDLLKEGYNSVEIRNLSFQLGVDYDELSGETRTDKARELITHLQRRGQLGALITHCAAERPHLPWPQGSAALPYVTSPHTAVVLDFTRRPALPDVGRFLTQRNLDANLIVITNRIPYSELKFLPHDQNWEEVLHISDRSLQTFRGTTKHFFLSAPAALAFGLGSYWGTVENANVYHYHHDTIYHCVLQTKRPGP